MILVLNNPQFGQNLRFLRKKYRYTRIKLARLAGCRALDIRNWETGRSMDVDAAVLRKLSTVLYTSVEGLTDCDLRTGKIEVTVVPPDSF